MITSNATTTMASVPLALACTPRKPNSSWLSGFEIMGMPGLSWFQVGNEEPLHSNWDLAADLVL
jgi:hypothetical protein